MVVVRMCNPRCASQPQHSFGVLERDGRINGVASSNRSTSSRFVEMRMRRTHAKKRKNNSIKKRESPLAVRYLPRSFEPHSLAPWQTKHTTTHNNTRR